MDNVATMIVTDRQIATDTISSKLIYFVKGYDDGGAGFSLHGDRGNSGARCLKGDSGDPPGVEVQQESVVLQDPEALLERLVKWDLLGHVVELEHVVNR